MPLPKLSPLQSRLAASLIASILVLLFYLSLSSSNFAAASDVDSTRAEDHNHERLIVPYILDGELDGVEPQDTTYEAVFYGTERSIIGRVAPDIHPLKNNFAELTNVVPGATPIYYVFENTTLWGPLSAPTTGLPSPARLRQRNDAPLQIPVEGAGEMVNSRLEEGIAYYNNEVGNGGLQSRQLGNRTIYVTINTCLQPQDPSDPTGAKTKEPPPQITLYISQTSQNQRPGPEQPPSLQKSQTAVGGFANITLQASGDVFISVFAPNTTNFVKDVYSVELAASIDAPFHGYTDNRTNLYLVDSDSSSALLVTNNLTTSVGNSDYEAWMSLSPAPYVIFAANKNNTFFRGVQNSYCGLEKYAQIAGTKDGLRTSMVNSSMTNMTLGPLPKQQFYFQGLKGSSMYYGTLAMQGNSTKAGNGVVGGGGHVWQTMNFPTQSGIIEVTIRHIRP
jgi:calcium channel MID1